MPKVFLAISDHANLIAEGEPSSIELPSYLAPPRKPLAVVPEQCDVAPWIGREHNTYRLPDTFVMPTTDISRWGAVEELALVCTQKGAAGLPLIAGRSWGVAAVVRDRFNGLLVYSSSIEEIWEAILKLSQDNQLRHALGANGRRLMEA